MSKVLETFGGQFLALITFFVFPALRYVSLKILAKNEGRPEIWYLPKFGVFRVVIRNIPGNNALSEIKTQAFLREIVPASAGASVATYMDSPLVQQQDYFLFPGNDQVLITFKLETNAHGELEFVWTDKLGGEKKREVLNESRRLVCDFVGTLENVFNFNVKLQKRAEVNWNTLRSMLASVKDKNVEAKFQPDHVRNVG